MRIVRDPVGFTVVATPTPGSGPSPSPSPATFRPRVSVSGGGTVDSVPAGIDCGSTCDAMFSIGTRVTLRALPVAGADLGGWGGDCAGAPVDPPCTLTITRDRSVSATFTEPAGQPPTVTFVPPTDPLQTGTPLLFDAGALTATGGVFADARGTVAVAGLSQDGARGRTRCCTCRRRRPARRCSGWRGPPRWRGRRRPDRPAPRATAACVPWRRDCLRQLRPRSTRMNRR